MWGWKESLMLYGFSCYCITIMTVCSCEKRVQVVLEHPTVTYVNDTYLSNLTVTTRRYSRKNPTRYLNVYSVTRKPIDRSYSIYFNFYELLSNVYKPSFVTLHFDNFCDWIEKDTFIGPAIVEAYLKSTPKDIVLARVKCPLPPGVYAFENVTIPYHPIMKRFPFTDGRIFINVTCNKKNLVSTLFMDMAIK